MFPYIGNNHPNWQIFFRGVQTTNQQLFVQVWVQAQHTCTRPVLNILTFWFSSCTEGIWAILSTASPHEKIPSKTLLLATPECPANGIHFPRKLAWNTMSRFTGFGWFQLHPSLALGESGPLNPPRAVAARWLCLVPATWRWSWQAAPHSLVPWQVEDQGALHMSSFSHFLVVSNLKSEGKTEHLKGQNVGLCIRKSAPQTQSWAVQVHVEVYWWLQHHAICWSLSGHKYHFLPVGLPCVQWLPYPSGGFLK